MSSDSSAEVAVERRVRVGVLSGGDELVAPGARRRPDQVVDAAGPGVAAQVEAAGGTVAGIRTVPDRPAEVAEAVRGFLDADGVDLLLTVGGVSVGPHDHLRSAFAAAGVERVFWGVALRPGHPLWVGARGVQRVLGLPGNPVSAVVCCHVFARAALGHDAGWERHAPLAEPFHQTLARTQLIRCRWVEGALAPLARQQSNQATSLTEAQALALIPPEAGELPAGTPVRYQELH
mgnify:CR=1 FL=1